MPSNTDLLLRAVIQDLAGYANVLAWLTEITHGHKSDRAPDHDENPEDPRTSPGRIRAQGTSSDPTGTIVIDMDAARASVRDAERHIRRALNHFSADLEPGKQSIRDALNAIDRRYERTDQRLRAGTKITEQELIDAVVAKVRRMHRREGYGAA